MECPKCTKVISNKSNLNKHLKRCTGRLITDSIVCEHCSKVFANKHSRIKHEKTCYKKRPLNVADKEEIIQNIKDNPPVTINNNISNIIHIENLNITKDTDFYKELTEKMGEKPAIDFIARSAMEGNAMGIFEKLYLDDKKVDSYPIACRDKSEFRFKHEDKLTFRKAREMSDMINEKVVNCIINASIYIINQTIKGGEDVKGTMFDGIYNLSKIQGAAQKLNMKKELFFNKLTKKVKIKDHPFFLRSTD